LASYDHFHLNCAIDDLPLKSATSLPVDVTVLPTSGSGESQGNVVSGLVEKLQASVEVTTGISKIYSENSTLTNAKLKRKKQVSRSQLPWNNEKQFQASSEVEMDSSVMDNDATAFWYKAMY